jgi:hypothetical protein
LLAREHYHTLIVYHENRGVRAFLIPDQGGLRLMKLESIQGPIPEWDHLAGELFLDADGVRRAILAAMRGAVGDTLDLVRLDEQAYRDWLMLAHDTITRWTNSGRFIDPQKIPDEQARPLPDGSLEIYLDLPGERLSMIVPPDRWTWRRQPS